MWYQAGADVVVVIHLLPHRYAGAVAGTVVDTPW